MDDDRVWSFEESLWRASEDRYHERVDPECIMALNHAPHVFTGQAAGDAVSGTPDWDEVTFDDKSVPRPEERLIVLDRAGLQGHGVQGDTRFKAACTSVYRRRVHDDWTVVQHAQVVPSGGESC